MYHANEGGAVTTLQRTHREVLPGYIIGHTDLSFKSHQHKVTQLNRAGAFARAHEEATGAKLQRSNTQYSTQRWTICSKTQCSNSVEQPYLVLLIKILQNPTLKAVITQNCNIQKSASMKNKCCIQQCKV